MRDCKTFVFIASNLAGKNHVINELEAKLGANDKAVQLELQAVQIN